MSKEETKTSILLVDDEREFLTTLAQRLELRGLAVTTATSGAEALQRAEQTEFKIAVVDLHMPGIDGLETIRRLKEFRPEMEIIMLTGKPSVRVGMEVMRLGARDLLPKPVEIGMLMDKINEALERSRQKLDRQSAKKDKSRP